MMFGSEGANASAMRPILPAGRPLPASRVHRSPPSSERQMPLPGPPPTKQHAVRRRWYVAANSVFGFDGSIAISVAPVFSSTYSTLFQLWPPFVLLKTPRSAFGPNRFPTAATHTMSGFVGCTMMRAIDCVSRSPTCVNVRPPSVERYMPSPNDELCRLFASPVPTYTTFGFDGATSTAPTDDVVYVSKIGSNVVPLLTRSEERRVGK